MREREKKREVEGKNAIDVVSFKEFLHRGHADKIAAFCGWIGLFTPLVQKWTQSSLSLEDTIRSFRHIAESLEIFS